MSKDIEAGSGADAVTPQVQNAEEKAVTAGAVFVVPHPFLWEEASIPGDDPEGPYSMEIMTWRPGAIFVHRDMPKGANPYEWNPDEDPKAVAHGVGSQIITVASIHKPGRFPTRVFYTRKWRAPSGREFGKGGLRIKTLPAFKRLVRGYRDEFEVVGKPQAVDEGKDRAQSAAPQINDPTPSNIAKAPTPDAATGEAE